MALSKKMVHSQVIGGFPVATMFMNSWTVIAGITTVKPTKLFHHEFLVIIPYDYPLLLVNYPLIVDYYPYL